MNKLDRYIENYPNQMYDKALIRSQGSYKREKGTYGPLGNIPDNGCGGVALHNVYQMLGRNVSFLDILCHMRKRWPEATVMGGRMGSHVFYIINLLRRQGYKVKPHVWFGNIPKDAPAYLIYYKPRGPFSGHFQAARYENIGQKQSLVCYNNYKVTRDFSTYARYKRSFFMIVWEIRK